MATREELTHAEQEYIRMREQAGATVGTIAVELHCSPETVRKHGCRHRRGQMPPPRGRPPRGILSTYPTAMVEQAVALKQSHPLDFADMPADEVLQIAADMPGPEERLEEAEALTQLAAAVSMPTNSSAVIKAAGIMQTFTSCLRLTIYSKSFPPARRVSFGVP